MNPPPRPPRFRWRSFAEAGSGLAHLIATQPNARAHLAATALVALAGIGLGIGRADWCALLLACGLVWAAEAFNTAIELLADVAHPARDPRIGRVKDVAAGAVLAAAMAAAGVGAVVFIPALMRAWGR